MLVTTQTEFNTILAQNPLVIIDFTAAWCGPCKMISPVFEELAKKYNGKMQFASVDVDNLQEVARQFGITAMPTFKVFLQGKEYNEMKGADRNGLENLVKDSIKFYEDALARRKESMKVKESKEELQTMSVKELKEMLTSRNISLKGLAEKGDLVERLLAVS